MATHMQWMTKARVKYVLAGIGAVYLVLFVGYLVYAGVTRTRPTGPSELEAHPERQNEILAKQRAEDLQAQLKLSDDQTQKVAEILSKNQMDPSAGGDFRERFRATRDEIGKVLTPEQQAQAEQMRGLFRGPGGPGGPMARLTPERIDSLKKNMTPDQRARFEKRIEDWQQRRQQWRGGNRQGPGGPPQR